MSQLYVKNNKDTIIVSFGGMAKMFGGIIPFEFMRHLNANYSHRCDLLFYVDMKQCWYQRGLDGISDTVDETVFYLDRMLENYKYIVFMGTSSGGFASILFGSLCKRVNDVVAFVPQTYIPRRYRKKLHLRRRNFFYLQKNLSEYMNETTSYTIYCDPTCTDDLHVIRHCDKIKKRRNVKKIIQPVDMKKMRDDGEIINLLDSILRKYCPTEESGPYSAENFTDCPHADHTQ
jgi:hypothetical protein